MSFIKKLIYYYYEKRLKKDISHKKIPGHIGIILDGNRRYAEKYGLDNISKGHKKGADKLDEVLSWCIELNIKVVTVWALSTDNFKRSKAEVEHLFKIIKSQLECYIDSKFINENKIRVSVIGKRDLLPNDLTAIIDKLEEKTKDYSNLRLYIALGYGGRQEICDALIKFIEGNIYIKNKPDPVFMVTGKHSDKNVLDVNNRHPSDFTDYDYLSNIITVENISKYLYAKDSPDPDLIIRTSGEIRLSGFLLWQSAYSEFYFCDAYWPEFREIDFLRAIRSYQSRHIRAGK
ncbi:MAG: polyprenyl diphosphate synthase [Deltaproteobacteria bacterium]|jgi:short-chain Z-isoprenyl diphosphate synthase|nr:polyprenyl diphosphate synthase [Deltaproteobacteria bacterium]MCL5879786.1 polyprenyl diphosphate synthase [Deltaproteobacteria bacterium]MDA8303931.1 polyprenyl diphosphate synthase [Deltaproteobacteria bacterium]